LPGGTVDEKTLEEQVVEFFKDWTAVPVEYYVKTECKR